MLFSSKFLILLCFHHMPLVQFLISDLLHFNTLLFLYKTEYFLSALHDDFNVRNYYDTNENTSFLNM